MNISSSSLSLNKSFYFPSIRILNSSEILATLSYERIRVISVQDVSEISTSVKVTATEKRVSPFCATIEFKISYMTLFHLFHFLILCDAAWVIYFSVKGVTVLSILLSILRISEYLKLESMLD